MVARSRWVYMAYAKPKTCNYDPKFMTTKLGKRTSMIFGESRSFSISFAEKEASSCLGKPFGPVLYPFLKPVTTERCSNKLSVHLKLENRESERGPIFAREENKIASTNAHFVFSGSESVNGTSTFTTPSPGWPLTSEKRAPSTFRLLSASLICISCSCSELIKRYKTINKRAKSRSGYNARVFLFPKALLENQTL